MDRLTLAAAQLRRMRAMTRYYHERFFADVRNTTLVVVALLGLGWWGPREMFLLVPVIALIGANQTAFDASYLHFARHYSAVLESELNGGVRRKVLVGADLEERYLYPLNEPKIVTAHLGGGFSWFGWMTLLYAAIGLLSFAAGLALGWSRLLESGPGWTAFYLSSLTLLTALSLTVGVWWFAAGVGERRLRTVLEEEFGRPAPNSNQDHRS